MYVYIRSEAKLYTVGFYNPSGKWVSESDHEDREEAAKRVAYLNGSNSPAFLQDRNRELIEALRTALSSLETFQATIAWEDTDQDALDAAGKVLDQYPK